MVMSGFDGFNVELTLSPRALKVLCEAIRLTVASTTSCVSINDKMKAAGYKMENSDIQIILTQMKLTIAPLADSIAPQEMINHVQQISTKGPIM